MDIHYMIMIKGGELIEILGYLLFQVHAKRTEFPDSFGGIA